MEQLGQLLGEEQRKRLFDGHQQQHETGDVQPKNSNIIIKQDIQEPPQEVKQEIYGNFTG